MKTLLFLISLSYSIGIVSAQHLLRVNSNPQVNAPYRTIQEAHNAAIAGDTIYVEGSPVEYESVDINKKVVIIGPGYFLTENTSTYANKQEAILGANINFYDGSKGSELIACNFKDNAYCNLYCDSITIKRCLLFGLNIKMNIKNLLILQNYFKYMLDTYSSSVYHNLTNCLISNNYFTYGITIGTGSSSVILSNNICSYYFTYLSVYNTTIVNNIFAYYSDIIADNPGNTITNNIFVGAGTNANGNKYNTDMALVFVDYDGSIGTYSTDGKWQLKTASPAKGAGTGGIDCGIFGGTTPYILSGLPPIPRIYEATVPTTGTTAAGLSVTVKVKSQN
jgi:hypothetical protein